MDILHLLLKLLTKMLIFLGCFSLDVIYKIAMIIIAAFNASFAVYIFRGKNVKDDAQKEKDYKVQLLKTLVLDFGLKKFYEVFDLILKETKPMCLDSTNEKYITPLEVNEKIQDHFVTLRLEFYDNILGIEKSLHRKIEEEIDRLNDSLTNSLVNEVNDFQNPTIYQEQIEQKISSCKSNVISTLFNYRGHASI
ncbi:hypothetical protein [Flectobacillus roseus]|uniref:hypothetical protein n=1 Tax=Flectobacillus roseus TaxID=502259 RepID=UPI0024B7C3CA|nr:hypothetical protein [Flectobacillus roseus]MDI9871091.1 hypothetical protein [Flectobacillus roseus]